MAMKISAKLFSSSDFTEYSGYEVRGIDLSRFTENPVMLESHRGWTLDGIIGYWTDIKLEGGDLYANGYVENEDAIGHLSRGARGVSIGFDYSFNKDESLNIIPHEASLVAVPALQSALVNKMELSKSGNTGVFASKKNEIKIMEQEKQEKLNHGAPVAPPSAPTTPPAPAQEVSGSGELSQPPAQENVSGSNPAPASVPSTGSEASDAEVSRLAKAAEEVQRQLSALQAANELRAQEIALLSAQKTAAEQEAELARVKANQDLDVLTDAQKEQTAMQPSDTLQEKSIDDVFAEVEKLCMNPDIHGNVSGSKIQALLNKHEVVFDFETQCVKDQEKYVLGGVQAIVDDMQARYVNHNPVLEEELKINKK